MITIDCTKGKITKYEVVVTYRDLTFRVIFHDYKDARILFMELTQEEIEGLRVWISDLSTIPDC